MFSPEEVSIGDTRTVTVLPEDSDVVGYTTAFDCPFARAVCRTFGFSTDDLVAGVTTNHTEMFHGLILPVATDWEHPEALPEAIRKWDMYHEPVPAGDYVLTCTRKYPG